MKHSFNTLSCSTLHFLCFQFVLFYKFEYHLALPTQITHTLSPSIYPARWILFSQILFSHGFTQSLALKVWFHEVLMVRINTVLYLLLLHKSQKQFWMPVAFFFTVSFLFYLNTMLLLSTAPFQTETKVKTYW